MVSQCLHYNYRTTQNETNPNCVGTFEKCREHKYCPIGSDHYCFLLIAPQTNLTSAYVTSAGCYSLSGSPQSDKCTTDCIGVPKASRFFCCCTGNLCNMNFKLPAPALQVKPNEVEFETQTPIQARDLVTPVICIVIIIAIITSILIYTKCLKNDRIMSRTNRRDKDLNDGLDSRELNDLRNNHHDVSLMMPFRSSSATDDDYFTNNNMHFTKQPSLNANQSPHHSFHHHSLHHSLHHDHHLHHDANGFIDRPQNELRIDLNCVKLLETIGSGRFGTVHRAKINDSEEVAVKVISHADHHSWLNEQQIYRSPRTKHENILNFLCADEHLESNSCWLIVEYASKGSLYSFLKNNVVPWNDFIKIALGVVHGLSHLHEADIAHRDFKSKNVLLKGDLTPCITDFGVAVILDTSVSSHLDQRKKYLQVGTPRYMAPEVLECSVTFTKASFTKIDVYALSLVLWELLSRCHPLPRTEQHSSTLNHPLYLPETTGYAFDAPPPPYSFGDGPQNNHNGSPQETRALNSYLGSDTVDGSAEAESPGEESSESYPDRYQLPFEEEVGHNPDINRMRQVVVVDKLRPHLKNEWRIHYPASEICRAIDDGWEYDYEARISASCFVERVESLAQNVLAQLSNRVDLERHNASHKTDN